MKGQFISLTTIDGHKPTVEEIEVRNASIQFVRSLFPAVLTSREMKKLDVAVLNELVKRKDLNNYDL